VVLIGPRASEEVPAYLQHADVLVVPHVVTPFTDSLDPIKLYEYQAARRPVLATAVAGFRDVDDELVQVVAQERFPAALVDALEAPKGRHRGVATSSPVERLAGVDWARRVEQVADVLGRLASGVTR